MSTSNIQLFGRPVKATIAEIMYKNHDLVNERIEGA